VSFTGVHEHAIDAKGRTSLPSRFREVLAAQGAEKLFVTTDLLDPCLQAYAPAQWNQFTAKVAALSQFDPAVRQLIRSFVAPAQECAVDKLGRILIPPTLREHAGLTTALVWAGSVDRIEVWSPERWAEKQREIQSDDVKKALTTRLQQLL
jgi:MraZ protein